MRLDRRTIAGVVLATLAAGAVLLATRDAPGDPVLIAGRDLAVGRPLTEADLTTRIVGDTAGLVADPAEALSGWSLSAPIAGGEPLVPSLLRRPERLAAPDVLAMELDSAAAVAGDLITGDLVDVYLTVAPREAGTAPATSRIASGVPVVDVVARDSFGGSGRVSVLVAVDEGMAERLTSGIHRGELHLVRLDR